MNIKELLEELNKYKDTQEYKDFVSGLVNDDTVKSYLETDAGKAILQPRLDSHFSKSLETWKTNNLQGLVDAKVKELYPEADPKDTELAKVRAELEQMKANNLRKDLTNKALKVMTDKKLPVDLVDYLVGADEKTTDDNLSKFEKAFNAALNSAVESKMKGNSYVPPDDDSEEMDGVTKAFAKLNPGIDIK